jgi:hypothetical protein
MLVTGVNHLLQLRQMNSFLLKGMFELQINWGMHQLKSIYIFVQADMEQK